MKEAQANYASISAIMEQDTVLKIRAFNTAYDAALVAKLMLEGIIAEQAGELDKAESALKKAAIQEENMVYNEPKDWLLPPLQYLGQVQLKLGKFKEAEESFRKDLSFNPNNAWSLKGLQIALKKQGKTQDAAQLSIVLNRSLQGTDIKTEFSVY